MKIKKTFWGALVISGSLGVSAAAAHDSGWNERSHATQTRDEWTVAGDDAALPPGVPGVTDEPIGVVESEPMAVEHALAANGYDPGRVDGVIDGDTRAAIREFQRDRDLGVTGAIDHDTGEELQMSRYSDKRAYPGS